MMLEAEKSSLEKVSVDKNLFEKELLKTIKELTTDEADILYYWVVAKFSKTHKEIINKVFDEEFWN